MEDWSKSVKKRDIEVFQTRLQQIAKKQLFYFDDDVAMAESRKNRVVNWMGFY